LLTIPTRIAEGIIIKPIGGRVIEFVIQYETKVGERWFPVVRFDASHGFPHRDLLDAQGNVEKQRLSFRDYNEALAYAEADINLNWMRYKRRLIKGGQGK